MERLTKWNEQTEQAELLSWDEEEWKDFMGSLDVPIVTELSIAINKLAEYEDLEEQGMLLRFPVAIGDTVYAITTCKDFEKVLDGTLWDAGGGFGTATGYYCPYELRDSCPHEEGFEECEGGCECFENKLAVFEDCVDGIAVYEDGTYVFLENCGSISSEDFGRIIFLTREEAEAALEGMVDDGKTEI